MNRGLEIATCIVPALITHQWLRQNDTTALSTVVSVLVIVPALPLAATSMNNWSPLNAVISTYGTFYLTLALSVIIYRLSPYHPLAEVPGPAIMRITKLWGAYVGSKGQTHVYLKALHDKYGPTIRIGPNEISTIEKSLLPQIFGNHGIPKGPMWIGRKLPQFKEQQNSGMEVLIDNREPKLHAQLRKPWEKAFASEPLKSYEACLIHRIRQINAQLCRFTEEGAEGIANIDISKWISYFAVDVMGDIAFGGSFNLLKDGDKYGRFHAMEEALVLPSILQHIPWATKFVYALPKVGDKLARFISFGVEHALQRFRMDVKDKDLFYYMAEALGDDLHMNQGVIVSNALLAIIAGSDTSSVTLSCVMYLLLSHPAALKRLRREVDQTFDEHDIPNFDVEIDYDDEQTHYNEVLTAMPYLNAVLHEGLRLFPAVPTGLQRAPAKGSGGKLLDTPNGGFYLPEGNAVTVPPYVMHRNLFHFSPSPEAFLPERWLHSSEQSAQNTSNPTVHTAHDAFIPFSLGHQNCVGRPLALMEMRYLLATLIRNFNIEFDGSDVGLKQWEDGLKDRYTFQTKGILPVRLSKRVD